MSNHLNLNELEQDFLTELFNIGIGNAANSLSQIVDQEIEMSVPQVMFLHVDELKRLIAIEGEICAISQSVNGVFSADSMLLFPEAGSMDVVKQMLGDGYSPETLAELHQEGFSEIGNVVLNACIGAFAQTIHEHFEVGLPQYKHGDFEHVIGADNQKEVLFIRIDIALSQSQIQGYLVFLLSKLSLNNLRDTMAKMMDGIT